MGLPQPCHTAGSLLRQPAAAVTTPLLLTVTWLHLLSPGKQRARVLLPEIAWTQLRRSGWQRAWVLWTRRLHRLGSWRAGVPGKGQLWAQHRRLHLPLPGWVQQRLGCLQIHLQLVAASTPLAAREPHPQITASGTIGS